ncbi:FAD-dependent oxidoreductase [beta proteobacterium MWH-UniP1]
MVTRTDIAVIGAGLAGAACARVLARAGLQVTVFEAASSPATGASGNPIGILHPLVSKDHNLASQLVELGMATTLRWLRELAPIAQVKGIGALGKSCGVLQLSGDASELVLWDPTGAWIKPQRFVQACLMEAQAHGAQVHYDHPVASISHKGDLTFADGSAKSFDAVVVCNAYQMDALLPGHVLMLNAIRGTVSRYAVASEHSLPCVMCASGYATPVVEGEMVVGASYERVPSASGAVSDTRDTSASGTVSDTASRVSDTVSVTDDSSIDPGETNEMSNLDRLRIMDSRLADLCAGLPAQERTSIRSATLDRMPHMGPVLDTRVPLLPRVSQLHQMPRSERIWVLGGLGSRGLSFAPLGAEVITAQILEQPLPISDRLARAVDPVRFALRRHQRRK